MDVSNHYSHYHPATSTIVFTLSVTACVVCVFSVDALALDIRHMLFPVWRGRHGLLVPCVPQRNRNLVPAAQGKEGQPPQRDTARPEKGSSLHAVFNESICTQRKTLVMLCNECKGSIDFFPNMALVLLSQMVFFCQQP